MRKIIGILVVAVAMSGCKLVLVVPAGGGVQSGSGTRDCSASSTCVFDVSTTDLDDTLHAVAEDGYKFVQWSHDSVCQNRTSPVCPVSNTYYAGNPDVESIIDSDAEFYARPIFTTITVAAPARVVARDNNGDLLGEVVYFHAPDSVRVKVPYVDTVGNTTHFLLNVTPAGISPGMPSGELNAIRYSDSSCSPDDRWIKPVGVLGIPEVLSPYLSANKLRLVDTRLASGEKVLSVVKVIAQAASFEPYNLNSAGDCIPEEGLTAMRKIEVVEEPFITRAPPYSVTQE